MESFATPTDVAAVWRPLQAQEVSVAEALLEQASTLLRATVHNIDSLVAGSEIKAALAKAAVVNAVKRVLNNPDGLLQEQIDDYMWRRDSAVSSGALYLDANDLAGLRKPANRWGSVRLRAGLG